MKVWRTALAVATASFLGFGANGCSKSPLPSVVYVSERVAPTIDELIKGGRVPEAKFEALAADPMTRNSLYFSLQHLNRVELFPAKYHSLQSHAESLAAVAHMDKTGSPPDAVLLLKEFPSRAGDKKEVSFVIKSKDHTLPELSWRLAIVGPFSSGREYSGTPVSVYANLPVLTPQNQDSLLEKLEALVVRKEAVQF